MKKILIIISLSIVSLAAVAFVAYLAIGKSSTPYSLVNAEKLASLSENATDKVSTARLAKGITPPTNKWFSGIALQQTPRTVFPTPLAFKPTDSGFSYGLTGVEASADAIVANHRQDVEVTITKADHYLITRYDELSVDMTYYDSDDQPLLVITIASGLPYVFVKTLSDDASLSTAQPFAAEDDFQTFNNEHALYAIAGVEGSNESFTIPGSVASFYAGKNSDDLATLNTYALNRVASVNVEYAHHDTNYTTKFLVTTDNDGDTLLGALPHAPFKASSNFSVETIYGKQQFSAGKQFEFDTATIEVPAEGLDVSSLSEAERSELTTVLRREINATSFNGIDTYFSGKELFRSAQLLELAHKLDQPQVASTIQQKLSSEFRTWFSPKNNRMSKYFYYDTKLKTIVGAEASFGSDEGNDHHFHYGYFIYAASILAKYDEAFYKEHSAMINLLVADIANYTKNEDLMLRRSFDPYFGHSWASGSSPFDDGNNQESTSEAINAWVGISLWAKRIDDKTLETQAGWMLSQEVNTMQAYWLSGVTPVTEGTYQHTIYSLNWGGKRDYATFFTAEPAAKLGILLIPLNPTLQSSSVLKRDGIAGQLQEAYAPTTTNAYNFTDYLLMYNSYQNPAESLNAVRTFDTTKIDGANSQSYMYAWVVSSRTNK